MKVLRASVIVSLVLTGSTACSSEPSIKPVVSFDGKKLVQFGYIEFAANPGTCGSFKIIPREDKKTPGLYLRVTTHLTPVRLVESWREELQANMPTPTPYHAATDDLPHTGMPVALNVAQHEAALDQSKTKEPAIKNFLAVEQGLNSYIKRNIGNYYLQQNAIALPAQGLLVRYRGGSIFKIYIFTSDRIDSDPVNPAAHVSLELIKEKDCSSLLATEKINFEPVK